MKEAGRRCQRCGFGWFAIEPKGNPQKPRWFDETAILTDGQARMARRVANYERALSAQEKWRRCPNCGSQKVQSDKNKHFRPTGSILPTYGQPSQFMDPSPGIPPFGGETRIGPQPSTTRQPPPSGPSMWSRIGAFHAEHWRIIWAVIFLVAPFGSIGDAATYSGPFWLDALKFIGILAGSWAVATFFAWLHVTNQRRKKAATKTLRSASSPSGSDGKDGSGHSGQL